MFASNRRKPPGYETEYTHTVTRNNGNAPVVLYVLYMYILNYYMHIDQLVTRATHTSHYKTDEHLHGFFYQQIASHTITLR